MLFDVLVLNGYGVWTTDLTTGSRRRATERAKFLTPRAYAVKVISTYEDRVWLDDH